VKKILFIFHDSYNTGATISLYRIVEKLSYTHKYNIHVLFTSNSGNIAKLLKDKNVELHFLEKNSKKTIVKKILKRVLFFVQFLFLLLKIKPKLVYANTILNFGEVVVAGMMNIATIVHVHEGRIFLSKNKVFLKISDIFTSEYVVVSNYAKESLKYFVRKNANMNVIYNGIEIQEKNKKTSKESFINISVIGTIDRNKSQMLAIKACEELRKIGIDNVHLHFFGKTSDKSYENELHAYIEKSSSQNNITFHGEVFESKKIYDLTDIVLVTSIDETFSLVALEAFVNYIPVVASNVGGIPEVVEDSNSGLLFQSGDYIELSKKIEMLVLDDALRMQITKNAYERAKKYFSIDVAVDKVSSILDGYIK